MQAHMSRTRCSVDESRPSPGAHASSVAVRGERRYPLIALVLEPVRRHEHQPKPQQ